MNATLAPNESMLIVNLNVRTFEATEPELMTTVEAEVEPFTMATVEERTIQVHGQQHSHDTWGALYEGIYQLSPLLTEVVQEKLNVPTVTFALIITSSLEDCALGSPMTEEMDCCSRICDLVTASLLPYIEPKRGQLTKESKKDMLLSLSMVSRKIKQWASEDGCQSEQDIVAKFSLDHYRSKNENQPFNGDHNCLANIVATVVSFLKFGSQFVHHVVGNILSSLSRFLTKYVNKWAEFIHMLLISLEATISSVCSSTPLSSTMERMVHIDGSSMGRYPLTIEESLRTEDPCFNFTRFIALLKARLENVNWLVVTAHFQILRSILKSLKLESDDLVGVFMNLVVSSLIKVRWDLFSRIHVSQSFTVEDTSGKVDLLDRRNGSSEINGVLLGTVLQLFCSLVEQNDSEDEEGGSLGELAIHSKFIYLVPQLLSSCFSNCSGHKDKGLSQYLRHKMLILMNRLSFHDHWHLSHPASWLKLLRLYFEDLIFKSISECNVGYSGLGNCLEGSPFLAGINDGDTCPRHLQRLVIFLYFKCCFTLFHWKETGQGCACATETLSSTDRSKLYSETCYHMGLFELYDWLEKHDFLQKSTECVNHLKSCSIFALSFLQLYMEEDDMLFGMLLLLLDAPFFELQEKSNATAKSLRGVERDILDYITSIFHPVHLFHWFLYLLHYDHLVLVDYLISKDAGVQCVKYILRCLRIIYKFWSVFVNFSLCGNETNQRCLKKRKISIDNNCGRKSGPLPSSIEVKGQYLSWKTGPRTDGSIRPHSFANAKECLLSLKRSLTDLHQKSLFPYNPRPLLKSLTRFEELCAQ